MGARLAVAGQCEVTLYTRLGCHFCEEAKMAIAPLLLEFGASLRESLGTNSLLSARRQVHERQRFGLARLPCGP